MRSLYLVGSRMDGCQARLVEFLKINLKRLAGNWTGLSVGGRGSPRGKAAAATANFEGTFLSTFPPTFLGTTQGVRVPGGNTGNLVVRPRAPTVTYLTLPYLYCVVIRTPTTSLKA